MNEEQAINKAEYELDNSMDKLDAEIILAGQLAWAIDICLGAGK